MVNINLLTCHCLHPNYISIHQILEQQIQNIRQQFQIRDPGFDAATLSN